MFKNLILSLFLIIYFIYPLTESAHAGVRKGSKVSFELRDGTTVSGKVIDLTESFYMVELTGGGMKTVFLSDLKSVPEGAEARAVTRKELNDLMAARPDAKQYGEAITKIIMDSGQKGSLLKQEMGQKLQNIPDPDAQPLLSFQYGAEYASGMSELMAKTLAEFEVLSPPAGFEKSHLMAKKVFDRGEQLGIYYRDLARYFDENVKPSFGGAAFKQTSQKFIQDLQSSSTRFSAQDSTELFNNWQMSYFEDLMNSD